METCETPAGQQAKRVYFQTQNKTTIYAKKRERMTLFSGGN